MRRKTGAGEGGGVWKSGVLLQGKETLHKRRQRCRRSTDVHLQFTCNVAYAKYLHW